MNIHHKSQATQVSQFKIGLMFDAVGMSQPQLHEALRRMGKKELKGSILKSMWSKQIPTTGFSYAVAEFVHRYLNVQTIPYIMTDPRGIHQSANHISLNTRRYLRLTDNGMVIDLCADELPSFNWLHYDGKVGGSKPFSFMQSHGTDPSARAKRLAALMGYDPEKFNPIVPLAELEDILVA